MANRGLTENEIEAIFESDVFWDESVITEDVTNASSIAHVITTTNEEIMGEILDIADQSDQEEVDEEIFSDHESASECSEESSDELENNSKNDNLGVPEKETINDDIEKEQIEGEAQTFYWYGKDRTKWSKNAPVKRKTTSENIISFLPGLRGPAREMQPSKPLDAWSLLVSDAMLEQIVNCTNQRIGTATANYSTFKFRSQTRKKYRLSFIHDTNLNEIKAFIV